MTLSDVDADLILCQNHLNATNTKGTKIESFLTQFLLIRICGIYEKEIKSIMDQRVNKYGDVELASFVMKTFRAYQHVKLDDIRGKILKKFGDDNIKSFNQKISGTKAEIWYGTLLSNRESAAHGGIINLTFDDLIKYHSEAKNVIITLAEVLN